MFRIEYDAYRNDYERVLARNHTGGSKLSQSEQHIERQYLHFKQSYEKLKSDTNVKLRLLDDNRVCFLFLLFFSKQNHRLFV